MPQVTDFYIALQAERDRLEARKLVCEQRLRQNAEVLGSFYFTTSEARDEQQTLASINDRLSMIARLLAEDDL